MKKKKADKALQKTVDRTFKRLENLEQQRSENEKKLELVQEINEKFIEYIKTLKEKLCVLVPSAVSKENAELKET